MSSFFKNPVKGVGKYVSNPFNKTKKIDEVINKVVPGTNPPITPIPTPSPTSMPPAKPPIRKRIATATIAYVKRIVLDYKEAGLDTIKKAQDKPYKALGYGILSGVSFLLYKRNPDKINYDDKRKLYHEDMIMCGSTYNKKSEYYLKELNRLDYSDQLEYRSFIFFSLILIKRYNDYNDIYEKQCAELNNPNKYNIFNLPNRLLKFMSRIVDIGIMDNWRYLEKNLKDFDIDEDEWKPKNSQAQSKQ